MVTDNEDMIMQQVWVNTSKSVLDKARKIADKKRMRFSGFIGEIIEKAVEADDDKDSA